MKNKTFIFTFNLEKEKITAEIPILKDLSLELDDIIVNACDDYNLETKYGVHDIDFGNDNIWGWCSYEVKKDKIKELMEIWKKILIEIGYECGEIKYNTQLII
jgi:hypothetical protein